MAYDQARLICETRIFLGGISEDKLPSHVIVFYGDQVDTNPTHTGDYPFILWKTVLCSLDYLKASTITSDTSSKNTRTEKVGNVSVQTSEDYGDSTDVIDAYDALQKEYSENPSKFGVKLPANASPVLINGVNQEEVDNYRKNTNTTSIYNALPVTAFPKETGENWRRIGRSRSLN